MPGPPDDSTRGPAAALRHGELPKHSEDARAPEKFREIPAEPVEPRPVPRGRNVIAAIGINKYANWQRLDNAVSDAWGAIEVFEKLGFQRFADPLLDETATASAIQKLVDSDLRTLDPDDSLLLFFAGHGHTLRKKGPGREIRHGYLLPVDAEGSGGGVSRWIRVDHWLTEVCQLPLHHILVILDACSSGIALERTKTRGDESGDQHLDSLRALRSRHVITSARHDERARDSGRSGRHSLFTECLITGLTRDLVLRRHVTGSAIGLYLQQKVGEHTNGTQTPDFGVLDDDERGEFVVSLEAYLPPGDPRRREPRPEAEPLGEAASLDREALLHQSRLEFEKAEPLFKRALALREQRFGAEHLEVATSLLYLAAFYQMRGQHQYATRALERALKIYKKAHGEEHLDVAVALNGLAELHRALGAHGKAEDLYERALWIREQLLGADHVDVARSLLSLASLYQAQSEYGKAEPLYERALAILERLLGPDDPETAAALDHLASLYQAQGAYIQAEPYYVRVLRIRENTPGLDEAEIAAAATRLASMYQAQGAYYKAQPLYERALHLRQRVLDAGHPDLATAMNDLAALYRMQGNYPEAERLYERALHIREQALSADDPEVANTLNNLATVYRLQGAYDRAARYHERAHRIGQHALGEHVQAARYQRDLAATKQDQRDYADAERLYNMALDIFERALGPEHHEVATTLDELAALYRQQGANERAAVLYERALEISERTLGRDHPDVAAVLNSLACLLQAQGAYERADELHTRALHIREQTLGPAHPAVATSLTNLAILHWTTGKNAVAAKLFTAAAELRERQLDAILATLAEPRKRQFLQTQRSDTEAAVSFHTHGAPDSAIALSLALTVTLRRKGRVLDEVTRAQAALRDNLSPQLQHELDALRDRRAELLLRHRESSDPQHADAVRALERDIERLDDNLRQRSAAFRVDREPMTIELVQAALPGDATLIEFVHYQRFDPHAHGHEWQETRYVAYVLQRDGAPRFIELGEAATIDAAVAAALAVLSQPGRDTSAPLRALYELVLAPIRRLGVRDRILISPDATLHLVPFAALLDEAGRYIVEQLQTTISYVASGRDLAHADRYPVAHEAPLALAAPAFEDHWASLPGTAVEAEAIRHHFADTVVRVGEHATRAALFAAHGPRFLHIATHGFSRAPHLAARDLGSRDIAALDPPASPTRSWRDDHDASAIPSLPPSPDDHPELENALDDSGLVLAGEGRDAIVTAREMATIDLRGTRLVVLSACETGVGQVTRSEGIYGLRRAITIAGAQTQVVSLWRVDDQVTAQLMDRYYGALRDGLGRAEALRRAQLDLRSQPLYTHPFYWASFVTSGDDGPL